MYSLSTQPRALAINPILVLVLGASKLSYVFWVTKSEDRTSILENVFEHVSVCRRRAGVWKDGSAENETLNSSRLKCIQFPVANLFTI